MVKCKNCGEREGTESFYNDPGGAIGWVHMTPQPWCRVCVLTIQIAYAEKIAEGLPKLRADLVAAIQG